MRKIVDASILERPNKIPRINMILASIKCSRELRIFVDDSLVYLMRGINIIMHKIEMAEQNSVVSINRAKRIAKSKMDFLPNKNQNSKNLSPIDEIISKCFDIHDKLEKSNKMLNVFSRELNKITFHIDELRNNRLYANRVMFGSNKRKPLTKSSRRLFDRIMEDSDTSHVETIYVMPFSRLNASSAAMEWNINLVENSATKNESVGEPTITNNHNCSNEYETCSKNSVFKQKNLD